MLFNMRESNFTIKRVIFMFHEVVSQTSVNEVNLPQHGVLTLHGVDFQVDSITRNLTIY